MPDKSALIQEICQALLDDDYPQAQYIARTKYPFVVQSKETRRYSALQATRLFLRDGFIDRYSGQRLIFPGIIHVISKLLPNEFPFHRNWKMSECHSVYWDLFPTIDHIVPVARGGPDDESNWATTSMLRNAAKANWLLEELGWNLVPASSQHEWDGLINLYLRFIEAEQTFLTDNYLRRWHQAALRALI